MNKNCECLHIMGFDQMDSIVGCIVCFTAPDLDDLSVSSIGSKYSAEGEDYNNIESDESEQRFAVSKLDSLPRIPRSSTDLNGLKRSEPRHQRRRTRSTRSAMRSKRSAPALGALRNTSPLPSIAQERSVTGHLATCRWESTISMASSRWETSTNTKTDQGSIITVRMPRRKRSKGGLEDDVADPTRTTSKATNKLWRSSMKKDISPRRIQRQGTFNKLKVGLPLDQDTEDSARFPVPSRRQQTKAIFDRFADDIYRALTDSNERKMVANSMAA